MKVGLLSLGRSTFDVELANEKHKKIIKLLENYSCEIIGSKELLLDEEKTLIEIKNLKNNVPDYILILQITFTDASVIHDISIEFDLPISIWAIPEPRLGGRLRLNSFCGLNLASHTLGLNNINFNWLYKDLENVTNDDISNLFNLDLKKNNSFKELTKITSLDGMEILKKINKFKIAKIGKRPDGFTTCDYNQNDIKKFCKIRVDEIKLEELFKRSEETNSTLIEDKISEISKNISGLKKVDQKQLKKSVALNFGLNKIKDDHFYDAFAIRCWPETFTKYGGAVCASVSLFSENKTPCACEADVYGAITQLILQTEVNNLSGATTLISQDGNYLGHSFISPSLEGKMEFTNPGVDSVTITWRGGGTSVAALGSTTVAWPPAGINGAPMLDADGDVFATWKVSNQGNPAKGAHLIPASDTGASSGILHEIIIPNDSQTHSLSISRAGSSSEWNISGDSDPTWVVNETGTDSTLTYYYGVDTLGNPISGFNAANSPGVMSDLSGTFFNFQPYVAIKWQLLDRVGLRISAGFNKGTIGQGRWKLNSRYLIRTPIYTRNPLTDCHIYYGSIQDTLDT